MRQEETFKRFQEYKAESNNLFAEIGQAFATDKGLILKRKAELKERLKETERVYVLDKEDMSKHFEQCETESREKIATTMEDPESLEYQFDQSIGAKRKVALDLKSSREFYKRRADKDFSKLE